MGVLFFSLSISVDALGYSLGFGSKNVTIGLSQFFILNLINTLILTIYLQIFNNFNYIFKNPVIESISPILLGLFGIFYVFKAFYSKIQENNGSRSFVKSNDIKYSFTNYLDKIYNRELKKTYPSKNYLLPTDLFMLFLIFVFENAFSTFVFYTTFNNIVLFVLSNFVFHFFFFLLGFNLGKKLASKLNGHTSFVSGYIFLCLSYVELFL